MSIKVDIWNTNMINCESVGTIVKINKTNEKTLHF